MTKEQAAFERLLHKEPMSVRDLDLDAFADGVIAHRDDKPFHANPDGTAKTVRRLSWSIGWNERALQRG